MEGSRSVIDRPPPYLAGRGSGASPTEFDKILRGNGRLCLVSRRGNSSTTGGKLQEWARTSTSPSLEGLFIRLSACRRRRRRYSVHLCFMLPIEPLTYGQRTHGICIVFLPLNLKSPSADQRASPFLPCFLLAFIGSRARTEGLRQQRHSFSPLIQ